MSLHRRSLDWLSPGQPRMRRALRASTSFVLALARCGRSTLTPAAAPALTGTYPGNRAGKSPSEPGQRRISNDEPVQPNLARIAADGDALAEVILQRAQGTITQQLLDSLDERAAVALGRYGARQPTIALRQQSAQHLRKALLATALAQLVRSSDLRDLMTGLAVPHLVAQQLGEAPSAVFEDIAARLPDGPTPDLLRDFGARHDITPEAFGWQLVDTAEGPDFTPAP
jgi:hypothetical protein